jgi:hypothetical protein
MKHALGIYIIASNNSDGELVPQYVGRTEYEFGTRLKQHFDKGKFFDLAQSGPLEIFLIARANDGRIVTRGEATEKDELLIQQLEHDLIEHCVKLNAHLLNIHSRKKRELYVAGYRGDKPAKRDPAARALGDSFIPESERPPNGSTC